MKPTAPEAEVFCPKCKRYVGTFEKCPYCHARVPTRLSFRILKWGGLTIAVLGVLFLYVDLHGPRLVVRNVPTVQLSEITPAMNFAQVYINGKATFVKFYEDTRFLGMYITDENANELYIRAYDAETMRLIGLENQRLVENSSQPKFPAVGDNITIRGNLRVRPGFNMMIFQYAEGLTIQRPEATPVTIDNMVENFSSFDDYQRLQTEGKVIDSVSYDWATILTLYEPSSEAETCALFPNVMSMFGRSLDVNIGDTIRVSGAFSMYYGNPQLWVSSWDDLEVMG